MLTAAQFLLEKSSSNRGTIRLKKDKMFDQTQQMIDTLRLRQESLNSILENTCDGLWDLEPQTGCLNVTRQYLEMLGYKKDELDIKFSTWTTLFHSEDWVKAQQLLQAHLKGQTLYYEFKHRLRHKSGNWIWVLSRAQVIERDTEGNPIHMIGMNIDINQKRTSEKFLIKKDQFIATYPAMQDGIIMMDKQQSITLLNTDAEKLIGWKYREVQGKKLSKIFQIQDRYNGQTINLTEQTSLLTKSTINSSLDRYFLLPTKSGEKHHIIINFEPMCNYVGKLIGQLVVFRAIEPKIKLEQMKIHLLATISHEIKTPLTSIKGFATTLINESNIPRKTQIQFFNIIKEQSERLDYLVNKILENSSIESGRMNLHIELFDPRIVAQKAILEVEQLAKQKNIQFIFNCSSRMPVIEADAGKIQSVFSNLLNNAIKFTPFRGKVTFSLSILRNVLLIEVEDSGCGIPSTEISKIFDKFYRVNHPNLTEQGFGLGLSIVSQIVTQHKGWIEVKSKLNKGTVFRIYLPLNCSS